MRTISLYYVLFIDIFRSVSPQERDVFEVELGKIRVDAGRLHGTRREGT